MCGGDYTLILTRPQRKEMTRAWREQTPTDSFFDADKQGPF
jgi:hypothetical protein